MLQSRPNEEVDRYEAAVAITRLCEGFCRNDENPPVDKSVGENIFERNSQFLDFLVDSNDRKVNFDVVGRAITSGSLENDCNNCPTTNPLDLSVKKRIVDDLLSNKIPKTLNNNNNNKVSSVGLDTKFLLDEKSPNIFNAVSIPLIKILPSSPFHVLNKVLLVESPEICKDENVNGVSFLPFQNFKPSFPPLVIAQQNNQSFEKVTEATPGCVYCSQVNVVADKLNSVMVFPKMTEVTCKESENGLRTFNYEKPIWTHLSTKPTTSKFGQAHKVVKPINDSKLIKFTPHGLSSITKFYQKSVVKCNSTARFSRKFRKRHLSGETKTCQRVLEGSSLDTDSCKKRKELLPLPVSRELETEDLSQLVPSGLSSLTNFYQKNRMNKFEPKHSKRKILKTSAMKFKNNGSEAGETSSDIEDTKVKRIPLPLTVSCESELGGFYCGFHNETNNNNNIINNNNNNYKIHDNICKEELMKVTGCDDIKKYSNDPRPFLDLFSNNHFPLNSTSRSVEMDFKVSDSSKVTRKAIKYEPGWPSGAATLLLNHHLRTDVDSNKDTNITKHPVVSLFADEVASSILRLNAAGIPQFTLLSKQSEWKIPTYVTELDTSDATTKPEIIKGKLIKTGDGELLSLGEIKCKNDTENVRNKFSSRMMSHNLDIKMEHGDVFTIQHFALSPDEDGDYALHVAVAKKDLKMVEYLVEVMKHLGSDVNCRDAIRQTPLHLAVEMSHNEIVPYLMDAGANPYLSDSKGLTCLHLAVLHGNNLGLELMLKHPTSSKFNYDVKDYEGLTALHLAVMKGRAVACRLLIKSGLVNIEEKEGKSGKTALYLAAEFNHPAILLDLLRAGASEREADYSGYTPYQVASAKSNYDITKKFEEWQTVKGKHKFSSVS